MTPDAPEQVLEPTNSTQRTVLLVAIPVAIFLVVGVVTRSAFVLTLLLVVLVAALFFGSDAIKGALRWHPPELVVHGPYPLGARPTVVYRRRPRRPTDISACEVLGELECVERVEYQQGTDTRTDTRTVFTYETSGDGEGGIDGLRAELPLNIASHAGAPTMDLRHNQIIWKLEVEVSGQRMPKDKHTFELRVSPELDVSLRPRPQDS